MSNEAFIVPSNKVIIRMSSNYLPFALAIKARTWSKFSHVDFVLPDGKFLGAIPLGGVCVHRHRYPIEEYFELDVSKAEAKEIWENAVKHIGKPYDFIGILGFATNRDWQEEDSWFCSEYVAGCVQPVKPMFNELPSRISPRDLAIHVLLKKIDIPEELKNARH